MTLLDKHCSLQWRSNHLKVRGLVRYMILFSFYLFCFLSILRKSGPLKFSKGGWAKALPLNGATPLVIVALKMGHTTTNMAVINSYQFCTWRSTSRCDMILINDVNNVMNAACTKENLVSAIFLKCSSGCCDIFQIMRWTRKPVSAARDSQKLYFLISWQTFLLTHLHHLFVTKCNNTKSICAFCFSVANFGYEIARVGNTTWIVYHIQQQWARAF